MTTLTNPGNSPPQNPAACGDCDPVALSDIAARLHMRRATLDMIQHRGGVTALPEPRWTVGGWGAWEWLLDVVPWARRPFGRHPGQHPEGRWPQGLAVPDPPGPHRCAGCVPVGLEEIAVLTGVKRETLTENRSRNRPNALPDPRWFIGGRPAWDRRLDVLPWALRTGSVPPGYRDHTGPAGLAEIAQVLGISRKALQAIQDGPAPLPPPRWVVESRPTWDLQLDVLPWALVNEHWPPTHADG